MKRFRSIFILTLLCLVAIALGALPVWGQRLDGTLRGEVVDPSGAVVAAAQVTATNQATGVSSKTVTTSAGSYVFPNLLVGTYTVTVGVPGFQTNKREGIDVLASQVVEANFRLDVGGATTTVEVTAGGEVVQTATSQLSNTFNDRAVLSVPVVGAGASVLDFALLAPNTTSQGGGVLGNGGSVGGTRPRMNNFAVDGVDDNDVSITGPLSTVIPDSVAEFNLITNQFSAEFGHSAGGQFNIITKSGSNTWHGTGQYYVNNRTFNAFDNLDKAAYQRGDINHKPRYDYDRFGGTVGGPIIKDKFFIFGAYEYTRENREGTSVSVQAPTSAGLSALQGNARDSAVSDVLAQFPTAPTASSTLSLVNPLTGATFLVPIGTLQSYAPDFNHEHDYQINGDLNLTNHRLSGRWLYNRFRAPNLNATLPLARFTGNWENDVRKVIVSDTWTINPNLVNDVRLAYTRLAQDFTVPQTYINFGNYKIDDLGLNVGPEDNSPQFAFQNTYQIMESMSWAKGKHTFKWGFEGRRWIAPSSFLPRQRGEWDYANLQELVSDIVPTGLNGALRGAGKATFDGNQSGFYWYFQDDFKVTPRLTLNLGLRYEYLTNPADARLQELNAIASVPGIIDFHNPKTDKNNFAPRFGFAWDPTGSGKWAIRGGAGVAFDTTFQNLTLLQLPPQLQTEQNPGLTCALATAPAWCGSYLAKTGGIGFLAGGGLMAVNVPPTTAAEARTATQSLIVDTVQPKIITWSFGVQRELFPATSLEVRYIGTRSLELPVQARLNTITGFELGGKPLPTYFKTSDIPSIVGLNAPTLSDFQSVENLRWANYGFDGGYITAFEPWASSIYHGGSVDFTHRMRHGLYLRANYTLAHNIDNATNELFSSVVNPRRPQDPYDLAAERGRSTLDMRQKFTISWSYDVPKMSLDSALLRKVMHGWQLNGSYIAQTGQPVTALSGVDANGNWDSAGDRAIVNPFGSGMTGTGVNYVCRNDSSGITSVLGSVAACSGDSDNPKPFSVVGYVAQNPNARYVVAEEGTISTAGRNSVQTPGFGLFNFSVFKNTYITESRFVQFRFEMFNAFNHRNFTLANLDVFGNVNNALSETYSNVSSPDFLNAKQFSGGNRTIQLGLRLVF